MKHPFAPLDLVAQMTAQLNALQSQLDEIKQYIIETIDLADPDAIAFEPDEPLPIAVVKPAPEPTLADEVAYLEADTPTTLAEVVASGKFYVLDTETTGIGEQDEVVEVAVIDQDGNIIINTLVKPAKAKIDRIASSVHSITASTVENAPGFAIVYEQLSKLDPSIPIITYNAAFDHRLLNQSKVANGVENQRKGNPMFCAMLAYAEFVGEWSDYHGNYRWHKLTDACRRMKIPVHQNAHRALADAQMTLALVKAMYRK